MLCSCTVGCNNFHIFSIWVIRYILSLLVFTNLGWLLELWNCGIWVCLWASAIFSWWHLCGGTQPGRKEEWEQHLHYQNIWWWVGEHLDSVQVCAYVPLEVWQFVRSNHLCMYVHANRSNFIKHPFCIQPMPDPSSNISIYLCFKWVPSAAT